MAHDFDSLAIYIGHMGLVEGKAGESTVKRFTNRKLTIYDLHDCHYLVF